MKYRVTIEGREREVDVDIRGGAVHVSLDGTRIDAEVERMPGGLLLRIGGRIYDVAIGGTAEEMHLAAKSARASASVASERSRARRERGEKSSGGGKELRAPMPGRVVKVLVTAGAEVAAGDPCVVIEAMKMENELRAPSAGKIAAVHVSEGVSVEGRALLVTLE
jgi:biotin carboxyl carrier protein